MNAVVTERGRVDVAVDDDEESRRNAARRKQYLLSRRPRLARSMPLLKRHIEGGLYCSHISPSAAIARKYRTKPQSGRKVKGFRLVLDHTDRDSEKVLIGAWHVTLSGLSRFDKIN